MLTVLLYVFRLSCKILSSFFSYDDSSMLTNNKRIEIWHCESEIGKRYRYIVGVDLVKLLGRWELTYN